MSDLHEKVTALRSDLTTVTWPDSASLRTRADRRTRRRMIGAVAVVAAVVAGGALLVPIHDRRPSPPIGGAASPAALDALTAAPTGTLFAIQHTERGATRVYSVISSNDLGATWSVVGPLDGIQGTGAQLDLTAVSDRQLWVVQVTADHRAAMRGSHDGGRTWWGWTDYGFDESEQAGGGAAGDTLWFEWAGVLYAGERGDPPGPTPTQPPGTGGRAVAAISPDVAVVSRQVGSDGVGWYRTVDRGAHWTPVADPCEGIAPSGPGGASLSAAPDGSLWAVCFLPAPGGWEVVTSTDRGDHWRRHPGQAPGGDDVVPASASVAWRSGSRADLYRTADGGASWTVVAAIATNPLVSGAVIDADRAVYVQQDGQSEQLVLSATRDGGRTWTSHVLGR
jgi:hypothetical protein